MTGSLPDTLVVTASRLPEAARRTGRHIAVWTAQDLAALPVSALDDVLQVTGGVEVQSRAGFGVQSDFTMRGSNFKGVLVLLDGMPLNDPQTGHYLSDLPLPLSAIARIEVLRGPASALYGPDALGGVIHLLTYTGLRDGTSPLAGWGGQAEVQYGAHAFYDVGGALRTAWGATTLSAATTWQGTDGEAILDGSGARVHSAHGPLSTDFERQAHTVALNRPLGRATLYARLGMDRRNFNAYHFYTDFDSDRARSDNHAYWMQARLDGAPGARTRWQVQVAAKQHEGLYVYNPQFSSSRDYSRMVHVQSQVSRTLSPRLTLTGGGAGKLRGIESATMGDHQDASGGLFLTGRWQATGRLTLNGSTRLDYDEAYGLEGTPQASLAYNLQAATLRAGAGRAVRAPTYTERYIDTEVEDPAGNLGNPDLEAEQAWAYEAGIDLYPLPEASLHATAFYRTTQNLIDYARLPRQELFVARNVLSAQTRGLEVDARMHRPIGRTRLSVTGTYTLLDDELRGIDEDVQYKYALASARQIVQGSARLLVGRVAVGVRGLWKDRRARDSYGVVHGRLAYAWPTSAARLGLSFEVRNLFDADYADVFDAPLPGRWWIFGLRLER